MPMARGVQVGAIELVWGRVTEAWVEGVRRRAVATLALLLALTAGLGWYTAETLGMNTDTSGMLAEDLPFQRANAAMAKAFPSQEHLILAVVEAPGADLAADSANRLAEALRRSDAVARVSYAAADPFFRRNGLLLLPEDELAALIDSVSRSQGMLARLAADPSLRGLGETLGLALDHLDQTAAADQTQFADALTRMAEVLEQCRDGVPARLAWRELMAGRPATAEDRRQLVVIQPHVDFTSIQPAGRAMAEIRRIAADLGLPAAGVRVRLTGSAAMAADELSSIELGIGWIGGASASLVALLLWVCFRSTRLALYTFATMLVGLVWTFAFAAAAVGHLNVLSVAVAVLFVGLSVDFGIHFGVRYREQIGRGAASADALRTTAARLGGAMALAALAAAIGFLSFLPTDYVGLSELGLIAGAGMGAALLANLTLLPALLALWPADGFVPPATGGPFALAQRAIRGHARSVVLGALLLAVAAAGLLPQARFDFDLLNLRDPRSESVAAFRDIAEDRRAMSYTISILAPDLAAANRAAARVRALPEVAAATTLSDLVPDDQDDKLVLIEQAIQFLLPVITAQPRPAPDAAARGAALDALAAKLRAVAVAPVREPAHRLAAALSAGLTPENVEGALLGSLPARLRELSESLTAQPFTLDDLPADIRDSMIAADGRALVRVYPQGNPRDPVALTHFVRAVQAVVPRAGGPAVTVVEAGDAVVAAFRQASLTALVAITLLLLLVLRSTRDVLLVLTPLALAGLLLGAAAVLLDQPFNFANVIVLPLLLGLGISSGLYIVLRDRETRAKGTAVLETATPRGVTFSALTTVVSFGSLIFSSHPGTASMGLMLTLALVFALVCTLLLLPALLHLISGSACR